MDIENGPLKIITDPKGARIRNLQKDGVDFFFPQQVIQAKDRNLTRGGMHICSPIFGPGEGKGQFEKAPQHGELRDFEWEEEDTTLKELQGTKQLTYRFLYKKWGAALEYIIEYLLFKNQLIINTKITNKWIKPTNVELGWHPYFNAPDGATIKFPLKKLPDVNINDAFGPKIFSASHKIVIELNNIGKVTMLLQNRFVKGYLCIWTDWEGGYFCVEPLLTYKDYLKGPEIKPEETLEATFSLSFE